MRIYNITQNNKMLITEFAYKPLWLLSMLSEINSLGHLQWQIQTLSQGRRMGGWGRFACPAGFSSLCDFFFLYPK